MKKGFTIVEIIISISLILIVGVSTTFFIFNNKKNNKLETITREILEAANLYINKEVDEDGTVYKNGILKGAKGLQLSVKNLVDKGYIDGKYVSTLENSLEKTSSELYILASLSAYENSDEVCGEGIINFTPKWNINSDEPIYLCGKNNIVVDGEDKKNTKCDWVYKDEEAGYVWVLNDNSDFQLADYLIENFNNKLKINFCPNCDDNDFVKSSFLYDNNSLYNFAYSVAASHEDSDFISDLELNYARVSECVNTYIPISNGFFQINDLDLYVYRGMVSNNYMEVDGKIFRIVSIELDKNKKPYFTVTSDDESLSIFDEEKNIGNLIYGPDSIQTEHLEPSYAFYAGLFSVGTECGCSDNKDDEYAQFSNFCGTYLLEDTGYCTKSDFRGVKVISFYQLDDTMFYGNGTKEDPYVFSELVYDEIENYCSSYKN